MESPPDQGLRERKKRLARDAIAAAALELSAAHGFERVTVDAIAARAGVSRRSFFRYFPSKEAAIFPNNDARREAFEAHLRREGARRPGLAAVRAACLALALDYTQHRRTMLLQHRLVEASPALLAFERGLDREWEAAIARALASASRGRRGKPPGGERRIRMLAAAVMGVIRSGLEEWYASECRLDLTTIGREAFDLLEHGFGAPARPAAASGRPPAARRRPR